MGKASSVFEVATLFKSSFGILRQVIEERAAGGMK
jgi:hypothetical protein